MKPQDLRKSIEAIAGKAGIAVVPPNCCWFDGRTCPYGEPHGQFVLRPTGFCVVGNCSKLTGSHVAEELSGFADYLIEDEVDKRENRLAAAIDKEEVTLSSELDVLAEDENRQLDGAERDILRLAARIIHDSESDYKIVAVANLPLEE